MFNRLYPDYYIHSVYDVDFEKLYRRGFRAALFDIDNTLVLHEEPATEKAKELIKTIHAAGMMAYLISNNNEPRVRIFADDAGLDGYIHKAHKPLPDAYLMACKRLSVIRTQAIFFGDQLFTDIWGARNAGICSVLVQPVGPEIYLKIKIKRVLEKPILAAYKRKHPRLDDLS